jgi:hypothetical protein
LRNGSFEVGQLLDTKYVAMSQKIALLTPLSSVINVAPVKRLSQLGINQLQFLLTLAESKDNIGRAYELGPQAVNELVSGGYIRPWAKVWGPQVWTLNRKLTAGDMAFIKRSLGE